MSLLPVPILPYMLIVKIPAEYEGNADGEIGDSNWCPLFDSIVLYLYANGMQRSAWIVIPGLQHDITQQVNRRQEVFFREEDRQFYLSLLSEKCAQLAVIVSRYCLMTNHMHLQDSPAESALAWSSGAAHLRYTLLANTCERRQEHPWQNRYFSAPLVETYRWRVLRYLELSPVRRGFRYCFGRLPLGWGDRAHCRGAA